MCRPLCVLWKRGRPREPSSGVAVGAAGRWGAMTFACEPLELRLALTDVAFVPQPLITHSYSVADEAYAADLDGDRDLDVNADGRFDRSDVVAVLQAGKYLAPTPRPGRKGTGTVTGSSTRETLRQRCRVARGWPPVDDHGDSPSQGTSLDLPAIALGTIATCDDQDWFRFSAAAGMAYVFEVELETLSDSVLQLFGPDGVTSWLDPLDIVAALQTGNYLKGLAVDV